MRLLCINPNTDAAVTARVAAAIRGFLPARTEVIEATGRFGAPYIASRASFAIGGHSALDALARHAERPLDAVLLACFGDPALQALRELSAVPVIGMAEASCFAAAAQEGGFSIVTGGHAWQPMLAEFVAGVGLSDRLVSIRTTTLTGGEIGRAPEAAALIEEITACQRDGAARVILAGAGLAGLAAGLRRLSPVPIVDCVEATAVAALDAVAARRKAGHGASTSPEAAAFGRSGALNHQ